MELPSATVTAYQRQHIRPVLRVQRRTGIPAHHFDEFRRGERGSHPRDAAICAVDGRVFRRFLDGTERGVPESLHPHIYGCHAGDFRDRARHHPRVRAFLFAAAVQYLLYLLFSVSIADEDIIACFADERNCDKRYYGYNTPNDMESWCNLVFYGNY